MCLCVYNIVNKRFVYFFFIYYVLPRAPQFAVTWQELANGLKTDRRLLSPSIALIHICCLAEPGSVAESSRGSKVGGGGDGLDRLRQLTADKAFCCLLMKVILTSGVNYYCIYHGERFVSFGFVPPPGHPRGHPRDRYRHRYRCRYHRFRCRDCHRCCYCYRCCYLCRCYYCYRYHWSYR